MEERAPLVLDGTHGEGGGQILRTALFLSLLTGRPFAMDRIRQNRRQPGLKPQHEGIIRLLLTMTGSRVEGLRVGATELRFEPGPLRAGTFGYDIGTAGSIPLFLQTLLPVMLATPGRSELTLVGGTDVTFGPTIEWVRRAYLPLIAPVADRVAVDVDRRGFYPKGGGRVRVVVESSLADAGAKALADRVRAALAKPREAWTQPMQVALVSLAHAQLAARRVAERQADACAQRLSSQDLRASVETMYVDSYSMGSSLTLVASDAHGNRMGADGLGAQGVTAEAVGTGVAERFLADLATRAAVDEHLADHLVPWVALGAAPVRVPRLTGHLETNVWTCQQFLGAGAVRLEGLELRHGSQ